jgi:HK97 family phage major capsid protein
MTKLVIPWTDEQRTQWNAAKSELDALDERIAREEELRRQDQDYIHENEPEQRQQQNVIQQTRKHRLTNAVLRRLMRFCAVVLEMSAEERRFKELRAQGTTPDEKGGYTVPTQMLNKIVDAMKAYGGIASVAQILSTPTGRILPGQPLMVPLKKVNCWRKHCSF